MEIQNESRSLQFTLRAPPARSRRARLIARWFGVPLARQSSPPLIDPAGLRDLLPRAGQIVLITGPSGAGKSSLLDALRSSPGFEQSIDLNSIRIPDSPVIDCFGDLRTDRVLELLSRVGLAEAWTYLRTPSELSEGQRWRLRLAIGLNLARSRPLVCDEFAALLDRVTAAVVARAIRRAVSSSCSGAILATSHDDLIGALHPDLLVHCDFGEAHVVRLNASASSRDDA